MEEESRSELKQDRISDLPDCLDHHILSYLPSTKQAIQTTVLSKWWHKQWTGVPILIFKSNCMYLEFIFKLHNCLKIKKLHCKHDCLDFWHVEKDLCFDELVLFATRRHVEDLKLNCSENKNQVLPEIFFNNISLLTLRTYNCNFMPKGKVNWTRLKELNLVLCRLSNEAMEHILSGSPLLELIELSFCCGFDKFVITSKYLKRLVLKRIQLRLLEIICPRMEELSLRDLRIKDSSMFDQAMKNALLVGSLLESLELVRCVEFDQLAIASKSVKRLVIVDLNHIHYLQVSCTKLEKLEVSGNLNFNKVEFMPLPSSVRVNLDFEPEGRSLITQFHQSLIEDILQQLHHVNELKLGRWFIEVLSGLETRDLSSIVLYTKCLTLDILGWSKYQSGVAFILNNSPTLEKLVITDPEYEGDAGDAMELPTDFQENYWNSTATVFNCLVSHLKSVQIIGIPVKVNERKLFQNFVKFLLKSARVLEKFSITSVRSNTFKVFSLEDGHNMQFQSYEKQIDDYLCSKKTEIEVGAHTRTLNIT